MVSFEQIAAESERYDAKLIAKDALPALSRTRGLIKDIAGLVPDDVARPDLGELSFESLRPRAFEVIRLAKESAHQGFEGLPLQVIESVEAAVRSLIDAISSIRSFSLKDSGVARSPARERDRHEEDFRNAARGYIDAMVVALGYAGARALDFASTADPVALLDRMAELERRAKAGADKIQEMARVSAEATKRAGIDSNVRYFAAQANEHAFWSRIWLGAVVVSALATGAWAAYSYGEVLARTTTQPTSPFVHSGAEIAQLSVAKLLIFSVLLAGTVWCARIYRAHRHNYVVNRHRQNALASFETFVSSTEDVQVKNAVLVQATASIFAPQQTGYSTGDAETAGAPQLIELVRTVTQPTK